jgi:hypothetical protein
VAGNSPLNLKYFLYFSLIFHGFLCQTVLFT